MTVRRSRGNCGSEIVRLVECPFCGEDIVGPERTEHLTNCDSADREVTYQ